MRPRNEGGQDNPSRKLSKAGGHSARRQKGILEEGIRVNREDEVDRQICRDNSWYCAGTVYQCSKGFMLAP